MSPSSEHLPDNAVARLRWGRILVGGLLVEIGIFAVFIPTVIWVGETASQYVAVGGSLVMAVLFGLWTARKVESRFVLHGFLAGLVAMVLYLLMTVGQELPSIYILGHVFKLIGGAAGGWLAARR